MVFRHSEDMVSTEMMAAHDPSIVIHSSQPAVISMLSDKQKEWVKRYGHKGYAIDDTFHVTK